MHRKLIHSVRALGVALSLLTAGLILAVPAPAPGRFSANHEAASAATGIQAETASANKASRRHRRTQARDAMALPFFSFAQGLRRSNRS
ncbi:MAG: hypothetical protein J0M09_09140 [Xanthomonadales bacterium]|nr:hypothetical protein [Xanthomonadales bacterium]